MTARCVTIDFSRVPDFRFHSTGEIRDRGDARSLRPRAPDGSLLTPKQIRARARRKQAKAERRGKVGGKIMTEQEFEALYKPVEEWDLDELARGRPRDRNGGFSGRKPTWISRKVHEEAMERFKVAIKTEMGIQSVTALDTLRLIITSEETDSRGKPLIPAATKLQASQFLLEHIVGKPRQEVSQDISVKLQGILGSVMVNPNQALAPPSVGGMGDSDSDQPSYVVGHLPGHTIPIGRGEDIVDAEVLEDD